MKTLKILLLMFILLLVPQCGIKKAMNKFGKSVESIAASIEKVTTAATNLLNKINDISRLVDSKLESGEINQGVADLIDGRLQEVAGMLESTIQNSGGYIFDRIDGSVDNAFSEIDKLLDDLAAGILGNYVPSIINQVSEQLTLQLNNITSSLEELVVVTAGQTVYVVDKAVNGFVILVSIIILAIGLIILAIILLRKGRRLTGANFIGVGLIGVFMVVLLIIIFSAKVRGKIIAGFDYGTALQVKEIPPVITSVVPENIVLGKTKRIYIYGRHLNQLENISVKLTQGPAERFTFPATTLIVATSNRIILGNLDRELQWIVPLYPAFRQYMSDQGAYSSTSENQVVQFNSTFNAALYSDIKPGVSIQGATETRVIGRQERALDLNSAVVRANFPRQMQKVTSDQVREQKKNIAISAVGMINYNGLIENITRFFLNRFKIAEGDYGLKVFVDTILIDSPLFVTVLNPPPPVPDPDIFVMNMDWTGGIAPVAGQSATLDITFGFSHPEQIKRDFNARVTTAPNVASLNVNVPKGKIDAACSGNKVVVTSNPFSVSAKGTYRFSCSADDANDIQESDPGNNTFSRYLSVGEYVYEVTLDNFSFEPLASFQFSQAELSYTIVQTAGSYPNNICSEVTDVSKNTISPLGCSGTFQGLNEGQTVMVTFMPAIQLHIFGGTFNYSLGNVTWQKALDANPTGSGDIREYDILREGETYKFHGKMTLRRRKSN